MCSEVHIVVFRFIAIKYNCYLFHVVVEFHCYGCYCYILQYTTNNNGNVTEPGRRGGGEVRAMHRNGAATAQEEKERVEAM